MTAPSSTSSPAPSTGTGTGNDATTGAIPAEAWLAAIRWGLRFSSMNSTSLAGLIFKAIDLGVNEFGHTIGDHCIHVTAASVNAVDSHDHAETVWQATPSPPITQPLTGDERAELERLRRNERKLMRAIVVNADAESDIPFAIAPSWCGEGPLNSCESWHPTFESGQAEVRRVLGLDSPTDDGSDDADDEDWQPDDVVGITDAENTAERLDELTKRLTRLEWLASTKAPQSDVAIIEAKADEAATLAEKLRDNLPAAIHDAIDSKLKQTERDRIYNQIMGHGKS